MSQIKNRWISLPSIILTVGGLLLMTGCGNGTKESAQAPTSGSSLPSQERTTTEMQSPDNQTPEDVTAQDTSAEDTWAVKVDGEEIPVSRVKKEAKILIAERTGDPNAQVPPQMVQQFEQAAAEMLVNQKLLSDEAKRRGVEATEEEKQRSFNEVAANVGGQGDGPVWEQFGLTEEQFRKSIDMMTQLEKLKENVAASIESITPGGVREWYEENPQVFTQDTQVRASHILMATEEGELPETMEEKKQQLKEIREQIVSGDATFEEMAQEHSACPSSSSGGDLNFFSRERMVKPFADAAFEMEVGEISNVVPTQFGYHLIKVTDKKEAGTVDFEDVEVELTQNLQNQKINEELQNMIVDLRKKADVDFNEKAGFSDQSAQMGAPGMAPPAQ